MFTLNDLLDQVECQGHSVVRLNRDDGSYKNVYEGDLRSVPYKYGCKELVYIYTEDDNVYYEVRE